MDEEIYFFCQHCNGLIESYNEADNHKCYRGKQLYQNEDDTILLVRNYENENKKNHEGQVFNYEESEVHNSLSSGYTANIESDEDLNNSADFKTESNAKKNAVWTKKATMAMLNLYEANIQMLIDVGKRSQVWKTISDGLKDLGIQVTADQVKWKFNRLNTKYKQCIHNNNKSRRAHMTFEYYDQFEQIFHKEKNVSTPRTFSTDEQKRKHDITESKNIGESKKFEIDATSSENGLTTVDESPKLKITPVVDVKKTPRNQQRIQSMELQNIEESQKSRYGKLNIYLKMKEKEMELKKKAIDIRETEIQVKRDVASEKLKFKENKHKDWLNIEKKKCELLEKLLNNSLSTGYNANIESDEDLNNSADFKTESNAKKNDVWTKKATMAMLNLYEANIQMLMDINNKSQVWKTISEGLKDLCIKVTPDQVKWKFNHLNNKYKQCIHKNKKSKRAHMTFEYYEQFEQIFHKEKNVSIPRTFSSSILSTDEKKRKHDVTESKNISESKKIKTDATPSENNLPPVGESPKLKTTPVVDVKKTARNQQRIQSMELQNIEESQKSRYGKLNIYLKMKEKEMELKKKAIDIRETEIRVKRAVASEKLKFNENKHKDWLNIEKTKCELLENFLKNRIDSEESH